MRKDAQIYAKFHAMRQELVLQDQHMSFLSSLLYCSENGTLRDILEKGIHNIEKRAQCNPHLREAIAADYVKYRQVPALVNYASVRFLPR